MKGYTVTEEHKTYKFETGDNGEMLLMPEKVIMREKHIPPSLGAAIYMSSNRDPENWKRNRSFEELFKDKSRPEDPFEKMSEEELDQYIADGNRRFGKNSN